MKQILDEIIEKLPEEFNMVEIMNKVEERTPSVHDSISVVSKFEFQNYIFSLVLQLHHCCIPRMRTNELFDGRNEAQFKGIGLGAERGTNHHI